jgi:hypothetical protein
MITEKIQNLFKFIDFLHSNIKVYESLNPEIDQYYNLCKEKNKYHNKGYHEQKKYDKLQVEVNKVRDAIKNKSVLKIINKANNLGLYFNDDIFNIDFDEIQKFKKTAVDEDLEIIELHKFKYLEFRKQSTKVVSFFQVWTFEDLDEDLLRLFEYFSENQKEFDFLKTKIVLNKQETTKQKPQPVQQVFPSNSNNNISQSVYKNLQNFQFFQIEVIADMKYEGIVYKNVKQKNNDSILTPENWEAKRKVFLKQRLDTYPESYTVDEKKDLELEYIETLNINTNDHKILITRYKIYLQDEINSQQETTLKKGNESLKNEITHPKRVEIAEAVRSKYSSFKNKDFKILYEAFLELDLFPKTRKRLTFFRCLKNEGYNINNSQILEDQHFKEGTTTINGNYLISDDEKQKEGIVQYLKTIINSK